MLKILHEGEGPPLAEEPPERAASWLKLAHGHAATGAVGYVRRIASGCHDGALSGSRAINCASFLQFLLQQNATHTKVIQRSAA